MFTKQQNLTSKQISSFDSFLVNGTAKALYALESVFGLEIESSDSSIELAPVAQSGSLNCLGDEPIYTISSTLKGDVQGNIFLLLRLADLRYLSKIMGPTLSLLFLSRPGEDLAKLDSQKPDWMKSRDARFANDKVFREQMIDTLTEIANVLIGLYVKVIYQICDLNMQYSVPKVLNHASLQALRQEFSSSHTAEQLCLVVQNEFFIDGTPIKLWCLISPTPKSFRKILRGVEGHEDHPDESPAKTVGKAVAVSLFTGAAGGRSHHAES